LLLCFYERDVANWFEQAVWMKQLTQSNVAYSNNVKVVSGSATVNYRGLAEAVYRLGQGVVVAVPGDGNRGSQYVSIPTSARRLVCLIDTC
jgi:hypothetical protein